MYGVLTPQQLKQIKALKPVPFRGRYRRWNLDLSEEQRAKIDQIEKDGRGATRRIFQERDEQLAFITGKTWSEIKTLLRTDQAEKFKEITAGNRATHGTGTPVQA